MNSVNITKINSLQGLRFAAFLMIFLWHAGLSETGELGVSIFFMLSGFLMYYSYSRKDLDTSFKASFKFGIGKIKRLYPLHLVTTLFMSYFAIKALVSEFSIKALLELIIRYITSLTLTCVWIPQERFYFSVNAVSWYLATSLVLYMFFPVILKHLKKKSDVKSCLLRILGALIIMGILALLCAYPDVPLWVSNNFVKWFTYIFPLYRLFDFYIGCNIGCIFLNLKFNPSFALASVLEILSVAFMCALFLLRRFGILFAGNYFMRYNLIFLPASAFMVFILAYQKGILSKLLSLSFLDKLALLSPYAFLIHSVVINFYYEIMIVLLRLQGNVVINTIIPFVITILLSRGWKKLSLRGFKK